MTGTQVTQNNTHNMLLLSFSVTWMPVITQVTTMDSALRVQEVIKSWK